MKTYQLRYGGPENWRDVPVPKSCEFTIGPAYNAVEGVPNFVYVNLMNMPLEPDCDYYRKLYYPDVDGGEETVARNVYWQVARQQKGLVIGAPLPHDDGFYRAGKTVFLPYQRSANTWAMNPNCVAVLRYWQDVIDRAAQMGNGCVFLDEWTVMYTDGVLDNKANSYLVRPEPSHARGHLSRVAERLARAMKLTIDFAQFRHNNRLNIITNSIGGMTRGGYRELWWDIFSDRTSIYGVMAEMAQSELATSDLPYWNRVCEDIEQVRDMDLLFCSRTSGDARGTAAWHHMAAPLALTYCAESYTQPYPQHRWEGEHSPLIERNGLLIRAIGGTLFVAPAQGGDVSKIEVITNE